ncbi:MAG: MFS transporter [Clostridiales bacterium]|nr:MFS transporter [Clostridiales bacterium]
MKKFRLKAFSKPIFNSRVKGEQVTRSERWLGYFLGPALVATLYAGAGGSYLNTFYTDVLGLSALGGGLFLTLMPVVSKVVDAVTNIFMGQVVENTRTPQGKARPWILISGPIMAVAAILLFAVPQSNMLITAVWVICSYNLYFAISYTMYNLSNVVTIPLSTRDNKQRDKLSMAAAMAINIVPGAILAVVFPSFLLPFMGVDQGKWILVMGILAVLAIPGTLLQYYFTRERITEENQTAPAEKQIEEQPKSSGVSLKDQIKGCLSSKYWVMIMAVMIIYYIYNNFQTTSLVYYSNWVLGTYNDGTTMSLLNIVGQAMLGPGVIILWPLVGKIGKQKVYIVGSVVAAIGGTIGAIFARNLGLVLVALTIRSIGTLPITYVTLSMLADALDHVEWKAGYRCDGFSSSVYSIIITVSAGIATGLFNLGLALTGYVAPAADGTWVAQSTAVQNFLISGMFIIPAIGAVILFFIFLAFDLEKKLPQIREDMARRRGETEPTSEA